MDIAALLTSLAAVGALATVLATLLVVADRWLHVVEDPRIDNVEAMLPHTNCGACGYPGCRAFAEVLVSGVEPPAKCSVSAPPDHARIAAYLGVDVGVQEKRVARLACAGGNNVARNRAHYQGHKSCAAAALVAGGGKSCFWGCLGLADCEVACDFDAIEMSPSQLPVVDEDRCTACGDCVQACPKDLFSIHEVSHRLWVACSSLANGDEVLEECEVGCTACGRCASDAPNLIEMKNGLPVVDYQKGSLSADATQRCPTGAIVWIDETKGIVKGNAAKKVIRQGEMRDTAT
ncbi:Electron transport complex protein rnfB [Rubripirellula obstinata]|uniref:Ion-translocating oxidoreductase complex subunit B n=1 Tax=Rubripirellula obstinata TaxID=406547 RepID=A0A5B1CDE2_9BACT|nr:RnfABCDGE type electron transport complex subunit B [Rubripirellula obstinata]KAA1259178.1 Electron transport complex protein rnfB [Rubripirellula obstinata]